MSNTPIKTIVPIKTIALTWWASWGHIFPLLSTYNFFKEDSSYKFIWVWEEDSLEEKIANESKIKFLHIPAWKIRRYFDLRNFYQPLKNLTWIFLWIYYILKNKIDIIFSKGWYVSLPLCIAALILRKKIYIHESDTVSWIANLIIWKIATKVFYTFPNDKINGKNHILVWQILNPELLDSLTELHVNQNKKLEVLVIAWSQWSTTIFKALLKIIGDLKDINFKIILWEKNIWFKNDFKKNLNTKVYDFVNQRKMWEIMKTTDIALTRAWATTLWELNMFGIHSIVIPLKNSAWRHQSKNARYFKEKFWNDILDEENNLDSKLYKTLNKYKNLRKKWLNLDWFFKPLNSIKKHIDE